MRPRTGRRGFNDRLQEMNEGRREQVERIRRIAGVEEPQTLWGESVGRYNNQYAWDSLRELTRSIGGRRTTTAPRSTIETLATRTAQRANLEIIGDISRDFYTGLGVPSSMMGMGAQGLTNTSGSMSMEIDAGLSMLWAGVISLEEYANMQRIDEIKNKKDLTNEEAKFLLETE